MSTSPIVSSTTKPASTVASTEALFSALSVRTLPSPRSDTLQGIWPENMSVASTDTSLNSNTVPLV